LYIPSLILSTILKDTILISHFLKWTNLSSVIASDISKTTQLVTGRASFILVQWSMLLFGDRSRACEISMAWERIFFFRYWGLNSGPHTTLGLLHQPLFVMIFIEIGSPRLFALGWLFFFFCNISGCAFCLAESFLNLSLRNSSYHYLTLLAPWHMQLVGEPCSHQKAQTNAYNLGTWEAKPRGWWVWGQHGLYSELKTSLGSKGRPYIKKQKQHETQSTGQHPKIQNNSLYLYANFPNTIKGA
jgi:hypothetical protein